MSSRVATLGDLRAHEHTLTAHCRRCRRWVTLDLDQVIRHCGADALPQDIKRRLRCTRCGSREVDFTIASTARMGLRPD